MGEYRVAPGIGDRLVLGLVIHRNDLEGAMERIIELSG